MKERLHLYHSHNLFYDSKYKMSAQYLVNFIFFCIYITRYVIRIMQAFTCMIQNVLERKHLKGVSE